MRLFWNRLRDVYIHLSFPTTCKGKDIPICTKVLYTNKNVNPSRYKIFVLVLHTLLTLNGLGKTRKGGDLQSAAHEKPIVMNSIQSATISARTAVAQANNAECNKQWFILLFQLLYYAGRSRTLSYFHISSLALLRMPENPAGRRTHNASLFQFWNIHSHKARVLRSQRKNERAKCECAHNGKKLCISASSGGGIRDFVVENARHRKNEQTRTAGFSLQHARPALTQGGSVLRAIEAWFFMDSQLCAK